MIVKCRNRKCGKSFIDGSKDPGPGTCSDECYKELFKPNVGLRYNEDKPRITLIPFEVLLALAKHYTVGAKKYEDNNWRKGLKYSETMDCTMRHIIAWQTGEDIDEETGSNHLTAAIWNLVALLYFETYRKLYSEFDDRWKVNRDG